MKRMQSSTNPLSVVLVSTYLTFVGVWLILSKQIPAPGFLRILMSFVRSPHEGAIGSFASDGGHCYVAQLPRRLLSDKESSSSLRLFEDGRALGPARAPHDEIRASGEGRYSHWGNQLYFSTSDNTDPRTKGRRYLVREIR
jgi:hypothetical protein